ncbi:hypothetical protein [Streptomyces carpinensis]|nr:hypothetical protein [Streptomyces carpinensis]
MSTAPAPRAGRTAGRADRRSVRPARSRAGCLRVLVLLLALLSPGGPAAAYAVPVAAMAVGADAPTGAGGPGGAVAEHDPLEGAVRTSVRSRLRDGGSPLRPTPPAEPAPARAAEHPAHRSEPPHRPYRLHALRCAVLRC